MSGTKTDHPVPATPDAGVLVVLGATGCVGRAVVAQALRDGHDVVAVARDAEALDTLCAAHPGATLVPLVASLSTDAGGDALGERLDALGRPIAGVVAAIRGTPMRGRLLDQPGDFLRRRIDEDLLPHLFAARQLLPRLSASGLGGYVLIGGPGADFPWAGYGHHSIAEAALRMLARVLHDEARALGVRVHLLGVNAPLRTIENARHACEGWPSPRAVARRALALASRAESASDAVVACGGPGTPSAFWSDDIDAAEAAPPIATDRALHDARALLRGIASSPRTKDPLSS
ncbi:MAG: SDR family NAD(P)-dependent oxidoreductase [Lysobacteraceae bacterium]